MLLEAAQNFAQGKSTSMKHKPWGDMAFYKQEKSLEVDEDELIDSDDKSPTSSQSKPSPLESSAFNLGTFDKAYWKKPLANAYSFPIKKPENSENHHQRVKEISDYLDFYDNLQDSIIERGEHRTPFNQKARAKPQQSKFLFKDLNA